MILLKYVVQIPDLDTPAVRLVVSLEEFYNVGSHLSNDEVMIQLSLPLIRGITSMILCIKAVEIIFQRFSIVRIYLEVSRYYFAKVF